MFDTHLATLQKKHQSLDAKIHQELQRPVLDTGRIRHYKLEKLHLKERMERLRRDDTAVAN